MGKRDTKGKDTRVLFKKSNHRLIQSRSCSETSFYTKCGILQLKKKLSQVQNKKGETIKRDLSIETDICILRRYCMKKMNKPSTKSSGKSKYSTIVSTTEMETIEKYHPESSGCGDSERTDLANNILLDTTRIMMDNLKDLLNDWIIRHLLTHSDAKSKLESALYSLLNKDENDETCQSSSRHTYVLNRNDLSREVKNKKVATASSFSKIKARKKKIGKTKKHKRCKESSCHSSPGSHKARRIISTLSIPRNIHKKSVHDSRSEFKSTKSERRDLLLSIQKSIKRSNISSYDLLSISTKSFTKRCATYESESKKRKQRKNRRIVFLPHASHKSTTSSTLYFDEAMAKTMTDKMIKHDNLDAMPSLMKSLYMGDLANIAGIETTKNITDNCTMTDNDVVLRKLSSLDQSNSPFYISNKINNSLEYKTFNENFNEGDQSNSASTIGFIDKPSPLSNIESLSSNNCTTKPFNNDNMKTRKSNKNTAKHRSRITKARFYNKRYTCFNDLNKRKKSAMMPQNDVQQFGDYFQNICKHFMNFEDNKNMKMNIEIKFVPTVDVKQEDKFTVISPNLISFGVGQSNNTLVKNLDTPITVDLPKETEETLKITADPFTSENKNSRVLIPLLDGAASQEKYIIKSNISAESKSDDYNLSCVHADRSTITDDGITKNIHDLKAIIMDFTKAAESFAKGRMAKDSTYDATTQNSENNSRSVQFTNKKPVSVIKLPKHAKNASEFYDRVMQKSNSYNIIESESIIRVTDMTSAANNGTKPSLNTMLKSRSLLALAPEEKNKFFAYFCDESKLENDFNVPPSDTSFPSCGVSNLRSWNQMYAEPAKTFMPCFVREKKPSNRCSEDVEKLSMQVCGTVSTGGSTLCDPACRGNQKIDSCCELPPVRRDMGFLEGFIYCLVLWIPVVILFLFFCQRILKHKIEYINPNNTKTVKFTGQGHSINETPYYVQLSDLGF